MIQKNLHLFYFCLIYQWNLINYHKLIKRKKDMIKPTLIVLAAGMGSRYGKLKQMDGFGPNGETIIDYSIYDAIQAGFGKVVFIVREYFKEEFKDAMDPKFGDKIELVYVTQELDNIPSGRNSDIQKEKNPGAQHMQYGLQKM